MKVFILGTSHSGKTPLAHRISEIMRLPVISAGEWVKNSFNKDFLSMEEYIDEITQHSLDLLSQDFKAGFNYLKKTYDLSKSCIIEGERNPHDFILLFEPKTDLALSVLYCNNIAPKTKYESGLHVIWAYLEWLKKNCFIKKHQDRRYQFDCLYINDKFNELNISLEENIDSIVHQLSTDIVSIEGGSG